jgi:hypothetical protein
VVDGHKFVARSQSSSCEVKLARMLVAAGVPDQPWQSLTATGVASLRGRSLLRLAGLTVRASTERSQYDACDCCHARRNGPADVSARRGPL